MEPNVLWPAVAGRRTARDDMRRIQWPRAADQRFGRRLETATSRIDVARLPL